MKRGAQKITQLQRRIDALKKRLAKTSAQSIAVDEKKRELEDKTGRLASLILQVPTGPHSRAKKITATRKAGLQARYAKLNKSVWALKDKEKALDKVSAALAERVEVLKENIRSVQTGKPYGLLDEEYSNPMKRGAAKTKRRAANDQYVGEFLGVKMYFAGSSYNAPSLKLYGYSTERQLQGAIKKKLASKKNPSLAQLKARAAFTRMAKKRAAEAKKANPRARNKAATVSAADIAKMPAHVQAKLRGDLAKVEAKEAKATTPTQKAAAVKARRSFLSRLGTRLRVIGQTKKFKVSARNLNKAPRKTIKIRARHETDAIAKAQAKLGGGFDQFKVQNTVRHRVGNPTFTITATEKGVHLGSFQDKTKTAALKRAKQAYGHRYAGIKATAKNPKRRNGIAKTAGKAIKKVTRAVLGGVSKVAGKGAKALKNPDWDRVRIISGEYAGYTGNVEGYIQKRYSKSPDMARVQIDGFGRKFGKPGGWNGQITIEPKHFEKLPASEQGKNPSRRRNLDHRDSSHQVKVHQHWRAGGLSQWQRAHHAGQHDLFSHGIKAKAKRNPHGDQYVGEFMGVKMYFAGSSYNAPSLKLHGYSTDRALKNAIKKKLAAKSNPSASAIRKKFAGRVSGQKTLYFPKGAPQGMAKLGRLVSIKLKGGKLIKPSRRNPSAEIWLCSDTSGKLWLGCTKAGPLYAGAPGDLGEMSVLEYAESKPHLGYANNTIWFHKMGEVSGRRPHLIVNDDQDLLIKGGNYKITRAGIVD